jgi:hypothetical protein
MHYWFIWLLLRFVNHNRFWLCIPNPGCNHSWRLLLLPKNLGSDKRSYTLASNLTNNSDIAKLCETKRIYPEY